MRGLKPLPNLAIPIENVASFTDAWIETNEDMFDSLIYEVASFTDAWIETSNGKGLCSL